MHQDKPFLNNSKCCVAPCSSTAVEPEERTSTVGGEKNTTHPGQLRCHLRYSDNNFFFFVP